MLVILLACQAFLVIGLALSFPFLALYLHDNRGVPMTQVGVALGVTVALTGLAHFLGGELCDLHGPKTVMGISLILRGAGAASMAWAIWRGWPAWAVIVLNGAAVFGGGFFQSGIRTWIAESVPASERLATYSWQRVALNIGWAIGPALGGLVAERSFPMLFAATAAICWLCLGLIAFGLSPAAPSRAGDRLSGRAIMSAARDRRFLEFCFYSALISVVTGQLVTSLSVHCTEFLGFSKGEVGWLFSLNGLIVILVQTNVSAFMKSYRLSTALAVGSVLYALGYAAVGVGHSFDAIAIAVIVVTFGETIVSPALPSLAMNLAPVRERGRYAGFQGLCVQAGTSLAPLLGGLGLERLSPTWSAGLWVIVGCTGLMAAMGFSRLGRRLKREEEGNPVMLVIREVASSGDLGFRSEGVTN